ncbi:hypothetical protein J2W25_001066 [Variovorax boronicumulans]|uniref:Knr4/Smi1-like domain-containing protein n=1 Tax=Variovorax boronicumulans TaxID=436515 RepID=A0AAW8DS64_9BURK|nr:SMI1/KNR4 family protein [Variovorax boronicumulans]MDP9877072.1 hypothetical protein [Variovorax boronicumulans]MDP9922051.1 hypothetical protein [Variovorax boronicumulans]
MPFDVAERYVQAAEEALGIRLPASYRLAMMRSNGGFIATESDDWDLYPIADDSDRRRLARTLNGVVPETERARTWHGFPSTAVALGSNGGGDKLVFIMDGRCLRPEVFIWRHETSELLRVADDFGDLVPGS